MNYGIDPTAALVIAICALVSCCILISWISKPSQAAGIARIIFQIREMFRRK